MTTYSHTSVSNRSRTTVRLPLASNEHINEFTGATVLKYSGLILNGIVDSYANEPGRTYVTNRPSISITHDASNDTPNTNGRGIYYWGSSTLATPLTYLVNYDNVYLTDYTTACTVYGSGTAFTAGTEKVYFQEWYSANEDYLFIINPEGNQVFVIAASSPTVMINMDDSIADTGNGAPFHASDSWDVTGLPVNNGKTLCHGAVSLDQYLFLGCKDGTIWNSNVDNWLNWSALDFITAERDNDQLLFIEKTKDHLAAFGERSTELMYDAANSTGSPLSVRTDIAYRIGIVSGQCAWADGDDIHFLGIKPAGDFSVYVLRNFELQERINPTLNSYLKHGRTEANLYTVASGLSTGGHTYYILTIFDGQNVPQKSIVYDTYTQFWYEWETTILGLSKFPLMGWSIRTPETPVTAVGILSNGDIFRISDNFVPVDETDLGNYYFLEDYLEDSGITDDYMEGYTVLDTSNTFPINITIDNFDGLSSEDKFMHSAEYVGNAPSSEQLLSIEWSDNDGQTWFSGSIDINKRTQINRMGKFKRRKFRIGYSGDQQIRIEGIDVTYTEGSS